MIRVRPNYSAAVLALISLVASSVTVLAQQDIPVGDLQGVWNNLRTGENLSVNGRMVQDSKMGQGRIFETDDYGANFRITYNGGLRCWYLITKTGRNSFNVAVRNRDQSTLCLTGPFQREYNP